MLLFPLPLRYLLLHINYDSSTRVIILFNHNNIAIVEMMYWCYLSFIMMIHSKEEGRKLFVVLLLLLFEYLRYHTYRTITLLSTSVVNLGGCFVFSYLLRTSANSTSSNDLGVG